MGIDSRLASMIDHTLLKPEATPVQVERLCAEAKAHGFASVCVNPAYVPLCARLLAGSAVKVCTVVGFPLGATSSAVKAFETGQAVAAGAQEIDMVINIGFLKAGEHDAVLRDIQAVTSAARAHGAITKVIIEAALLTDEEKVQACLLAQKAGADFVKTSTGFSNGGATTTDVALMRTTVHQTMGVKAAGGIRTREDALAMVASGANRIGASASIAIVTTPATSPLR
jgi:deoxyribose-phosphate aldolase